MTKRMLSAGRTPSQDQENAALETWARRNGYNSVADFLEREETQFSFWRDRREWLAGLLGVDE